MRREAEQTERTASRKPEATKSGEPSISAQAPQPATDDDFDENDDFDDDLNEDDDSDDFGDDSDG